jgi:hypothetical protein
VAGGWFESRRHLVVVTWFESECFPYRLSSSFFLSPSLSFSFIDSFFLCFLLSAPLNFFEFLSWSFALEFLFFLDQLVKFNNDKASSRRKMRKAHFSATSVERRVRMSAGLSKDLFQKFNVCQLFLCLFSSHSCFFFFFYL